MPLEITANNLKRKSDIKTLKLQNNEYAVTFFYYGDYEGDIENGICDVGNLSMSCKPKGDVFPLEMMSGHIMLTVPHNTMLLIEEIDDFQQQIEKSKQTAIELEAIMLEYFPIQKMK